MSIEGLPQLKARLNAITDTRGALRLIQIDAVAEAKRLVPRRTGNLGRSIAPGELGQDYAIVRARAGYAAYVELGTRPHEIRPKTKKALAWAANASGRRLSGRARRGAAMRFARRVHHPGTRAQPYLVPGALAALRRGGLREVIVRNWNRAA